MRRYLVTTAFALIFIGRITVSSALTDDSVFSILHRRPDGQTEVFRMDASSISILGHHSLLSEKIVSKYRTDIEHDYPKSRSSDASCLANNRWELIQKESKKFFCRGSVGAKGLSQMASDLMIIASP